MNLVRSALIGLAIIAGLAFLLLYGVVAIVGGWGNDPLLFVAGLVIFTGTAYIATGVRFELFDE